eukprot:m51a1_g5673 hypothetical protein (271) ;mRNA; r:942443-949325
MNIWCGVRVCKIKQLPDTKPFIIQCNVSDSRKLIHLSEFKDKMISTGLWEEITWKNKKKKKVSTGHAEELPPSMSLNQINAQYKFGEAVAQQYMAAKKHGHSTMFKQEIPVICYGSGSNASYLQLDHNHHIISILFIHVMKHYNFQLPTISDCESFLTHFKLYIIALHECFFLSHTRIKENFFAKFMNAIDHINPSVLALINNNLMAPTPHPCFRSHTNLTNLSFLYLSTGCQMICLKYIFSDNSTNITTNSALTDLIDHWKQHFTEPLS